jgi:hypothetical protein
VPPRLEPVLNADGQRLCVLCLERPAAPAHVRRRIYRCQPCYTKANSAAHARYRHSPRCRAMQARYRATAKGIASARRNQARRIHIRGMYHGTAKTPEAARAINAHIRQRLKAFTATQHMED